jgi:aquaporin Z
MLNSYLVEFLGSALFVFIILATGNPLAIGAALAFILLIITPISGGHVNPAVTIVMASMGNISSSDILPYILAQVLGALVALEVFKRVKL